jgi:hypothetical protein
MRNTNTNTDNAEAELFQDAEAFLGDATDTSKVVDNTIVIKTISTGYCKFNPERSKIAGKLMVLGRIGGVMMGVEEQARNPEGISKGEEADNGLAMVGEFFADVYGDDGEVMEYAGGYCYMPGGMHEAILSRFQRLSPEAQLKGLRFSYFIGAEPRGNPRGYGYVCQNAERVEMLETSIAQRLKREAALIASGKAQLADPDRIDLKNMRLLSAR